LFNSESEDEVLGVNADRTQLRARRLAEDFPPGSWQNPAPLNIAVGKKPPRPDPDEENDMPDMSSTFQDIELPGPSAQQPAFEPYTWQNPAPLHISVGKRVPPADPDEVLDQARPNEGVTTQSAQATEPTAEVAAHKPWTWENPAPIKIKLKKRQASPTASSLDDLRVFGRRKPGKARRIRSPSSSEGAGPSSASDMLDHVSPTKAGPTWKVHSDNPTPAAVGSASPPLFPPRDDLHSLPLNEIDTDMAASESVITDDPLLLQSVVPSVPELGEDGDSSELSHAPLPQADIDMGDGCERDTDPKNLPIPSNVDASSAPGPARGEEAVEEVRAAVADVDIDSGPRQASSAPSIMEIAQPARTFARFQGLAAITGGQTALEYLRAVSTPASTSPPSTREAKDDTPEEEKMSATEWRHVVHNYGDSDIEAILDTDSESPPSSSIPSAVEYSLCRIDPAHQPPPERRGKALREFNCALVDEWNRRAPTMTKNPGLHRAIFEAYIAQSELQSGEIKVFNDVDAEGAPPDFEFQCSNEMLYHPDAPDPELGLGCGCEGPCDPASTTCTCVKRQKLYSYDIKMDGFAYDK